MPFSLRKIKPRLKKNRRQKKQKIKGTMQQNRNQQKKGNIRPKRKGIEKCKQERIRKVQIKKDLKSPNKKIQVERSKQKLEKVNYRKMVAEIRQHMDHVKKIFFLTFPACF